MQHRQPFLLNMIYWSVNPKHGTFQQGLNITGQGRTSLLLCGQAIRENWSSYILYMHVYTQVLFIVNDCMSYFAKHNQHV